MPTNYTPNYQLNQWEPEDKVVRTDFNEDNAKIDAALAGKAEASTLEALSKTVAGKADTSEITRLEQSVAARTTLVAGFYTGDGQESRIINLGFTPRALLVMTASGMTASSTSVYYYGGLALPDHPVITDSKSVVTIVENGFQTYYNSNSHILTNYKNIEYRYLALM